MAADRTIQLRRYQVVTGMLPDFVSWFSERCVPARTALGFEIEFAYAVQDTNEFVWAVSVAGDLEAFAAVEATYLASPERAAAFDGVPQRIESSVVTLVTRVA